MKLRPTVRLRPRRARRSGRLWLVQKPDLGGGPVHGTRPAGYLPGISGAVACKPTTQRPADGVARAHRQLPDWKSLKAMMDAEKEGADAQKAVYEGFIDTLIT